MRDIQAKHRIQVRIDRLSFGNPGQHRILKGGVCELKVDAGPGYRVYYAQRAGVVIILLTGGNKSTQDKDIAAARRIAKELED